jgi:Reverse transcriptase (RNA-dependent DNA polymerase)
LFNRVKQGGISSPILFCVYIDELLRRLQDANIGCFIGNVYTGELAYADDVTLVAPTAEALRRMLEICNKYAEEFSSLFNANKSKCIVVRSVGQQTNDILPRFLISGKPVDYVKRWSH